MHQNGKVHTMKEMTVADAVTLLPLKTLKTVLVAKDTVLIPFEEMRLALEGLLADYSFAYEVKIGENGFIIHPM